MSSLSRIYNLKHQLDSLGPLPREVRENLDEWFKIELTYTSNAIEGNTLSRQETALVVEKGITVEGKSITEHQEAVNHARAWEYISSLRDTARLDVTEQTIREIQAMILDRIDESNAGRYRTVPVRIAGSTVPMPNPVKVPDLMKEFVSWLQKSNDGVVEVASQAHYRFVSIHPFTDGNGRTGRLLMNLILLQAGFPPAIIRKEDRKTYINSLEKAQLSGDLSDYATAIYEAVERSLLVYIETIKPESMRQSSHAERLLKIGELAKETGESVPTIRYWTQEGLLTVAKHTPGGYQLYHPSMTERVKEIRLLQAERRLTIEEIKGLLG